MGAHSSVLPPSLRRLVADRGLKTMGTGIRGVWQVQDVYGIRVFKGTPADIEEWLMALREVAR